jgi:hypothetical protein
MELLLLSFLLVLYLELPRSFLHRVSYRCMVIGRKLIIGIHPTTIAQSFQNAATKAVEFLEGMSTPVDLNDREALLRAAGTSLNSKVCS